MDKLLKTMKDERQRLILAELKAKELFDAVEDRGLIVPGKSERELTEEIARLAHNHFGIEKYWHKQIVRTGANTLQSYSGNPADLIIQKDDILFLDFGPIFEGYESDLGRTYVIGKNPLKLKLKADVEAACMKQKPGMPDRAFSRARPISTMSPIWRNVMAGSSEGR
jgi:Xaa-Pro aminopeptidase